MMDDFRVIDKQYQEWKNMSEERLLVKREGDFHYPIYFEKDFSLLAGYMKEEGLSGRKFCIVTDTNVAPLYLEEVCSALKEISDQIFTFTFHAGEKNKNLSTVNELYRTLIEHEMDRKGILIALGGGVVGDLTGFGAATYLRGVDFIQVPTTLLAQVDSSVGGKTGVDFEQYKNMVGAFHQPRLVYMNLNTLKSLPAQEFTCGMGEILKTGLICDGDFFRFVCQNQETIQKMDLSMLSRMIRRCCEIKAGVVERDPKEQGERALLNLGHTIGHAVEKLMNFKLLHGQCVGAGLVAAAAISLNRGLLTQEQYKEIREGCQAFGLPLFVEGLNAQEVLAATRKDKKMDQGHIKFILMDGIGRSFVDRTVSDEELLKGIREILR
jgi:3-dehydroquinate synthase